MKQFYQSTYYLWIVTKLIFAIAAFISAVDILGNNDLTNTEKSANYVGILYAILLVLDLIFSLNGNYLKALKYIVGTISVISGIIVLIVFLIKLNVISVPLTILFIIWILLLGFFDLLVIKTKTTNKL